MGTFIVTREATDNGYPLEVRECESMIDALAALVVMSSAKPACKEFGYSIRYVVDGEIV
jgi:hypothetical protein